MSPISWSFTPRVITGISVVSTSCFSSRSRQRSLVSSSCAPCSAMSACLSKVSNDSAMRAPSAASSRDEGLVPREAHAVRADGDAVDARGPRHRQQVEQMRVQRRLAAGEVDDVQLAAVVGDQVVEHAPEV